MLARKVYQQLFSVLCRHYATAEIDLPRIILPHKKIAYFEKKKKRQEEEERKKSGPKLKFKSPRIIACKRSEYNHHRGQSYSNLGVKDFASHGWKHRKSAGDHFTLKAWAKNPALKIPDGMPDMTFEDFDFDSSLKERLKELEYYEPTNIQRMMIPTVFRGRNIICAAETGSGKTLAYLLPLIEMVGRLKADSSGDEVCSNAPRAIVLAPTRELAKQIKNVAAQFEEACSLRLQLLSEKNSVKSDIVFRQDREMDIAFGTPGVFRVLLQKGVVKKNRCQFIVLDEADTLLDDSFSGLILSILRKLQVHRGEGGTQLIFVSATMPRDMAGILDTQIDIDNVDKVTTGHLHHVMPHVSQKFIRVKPSLKPVEIIRLARSNLENGVPTMIFCNNSDTCFWLSQFLKENSIDNVTVTANMQLQERMKAFRDFQDERKNIIVCTDLCSRGLDTIRAEHVINYDFPKYISDYIHRSGRVGRVGGNSNGKVTSFVTYKNNVDLLWKIETAVRRAEEFHNVNANIKRRITGKIQKKYGAHAG